jgi:hypothetical protein
MARRFTIKAAFCPPAGGAEGGNGSQPHRERDGHVAEW